MKKMTRAEVRKYFPDHPRFPRPSSSKYATTAGGMRVWERRCDLDLTKKRASEMAGIPAHVVSHIETGRYKPSFYPAEVPLLAAALGVHVSEINNDTEV